MSDLPIATRAYVVEGNRRLNRWRIEGQNGLFKFRVMFGKKQQPLAGELLARFKTYAEGGYSVGCFYPYNDVIPPMSIPVEKDVIQGKPHIRISWNGNWRCFPGEEWTEAMEKEAREFLRKKRITEIIFDIK